MEVHKMKFPAKLRKTGDSLGITIPNEVVQAMELKESDICQFDIEKADYESADELKKEGD